MNDNDNLITANDRQVEGEQVYKQIKKINRENSEQFTQIN